VCCRILQGEGSVVWVVWLGGVDSVCGGGVMVVCVLEKWGCVVFLKRKCVLVGIYGRFV